MACPLKAIVKFVINCLGSHESELEAATRVKEFLQAQRNRSEEITTKLDQP